MSVLKFGTLFLYIKTWYSLFQISSSKSIIEIRSSGTPLAKRGPLLARRERYWRKGDAFSENGSVLARMDRFWREVVQAQKMVIWSRENGFKIKEFSFG